MTEKMPRSFLIRKILGLDDDPDDNNSERAKGYLFGKAEQDTKAVYRKAFQGQ